VESGKSAILQLILLIPALFLPYFGGIWKIWNSAANSAYSCLIPALFLPYFGGIWKICNSAANSAYSCLIPPLFWWNLENRQVCS
jgi:hypothetical protein